MELLGQPARRWCSARKVGAHTRISTTLDTHGFHVASERQSIAWINDSNESMSPPTNVYTIFNEIACSFVCMFLITYILCFTPMSLR